MSIPIQGSMLVLGLALLVPSLALAAEPVTTEAPEARPTVSLRGPFGTVAGTESADPASAAPDNRPLDAWMRQATLELIVEPPLPSAATLVVSAAPVAGGAAVALPVLDGRWVSAPDAAGRYVLTATTELPGRSPSQVAWLLDVPDRPPGIETLLQRPGIEAHLVAQTGSALGARGHGCLVDMCQEVGPRPPTSSLEPLAVQSGAPLRVVLDDGSAISHWQGRLEPQPGTASETRLAMTTYDEPVAGPALTGLEPDAPGEWLLELRVDYDRERGWQWYLFRLVAE